MRKLTDFNIVCIILLWCLLCYIVVSSVEEITLNIIIYLFFSAGFVFIPIWKHYRKKQK